jgi:hypothetical protein
MRGIGRRAQKPRGGCTHFRRPLSLARVPADGQGWRPCAGTGGSGMEEEAMRRDHWSWFRVARVGDCRRHTRLGNGGGGHAWHVWGTGDAARVPAGGRTHASRCRMGGRAAGIGVGLRRMWWLAWEAGDAAWRDGDGVYLQAGRTHKREGEGEWEARDAPCAGGGRTGRTRARGPLARRRKPCAGVQGAVCAG